MQQTIIGKYSYKCQESTSEDLVNTYNKGLQELYDQVAPLETKEVLLRPRKKWVTEELLELKKKTRKAEHRYRKCKNIR